MKLNETLRIVRKKISNKAAIVAVALVLGVVGGSVAGVRYTSAYQGDCDDNAIVHCGRETVSQLQAAYNGSSNVRSIYATAPFNLSSQKMAGSWAGMQRGQVDKYGVVKLENGTIVARNAITAGRNPGKTAAIRSQSHKMAGVEAYWRGTGVNMSSDAAVAFIKLDSNGRFEFAIIRACGNPVVATPTQPAPTPGISIEKLVKKAGTQDEFKNDITVSPSQKVEYVVGVKNTGNVTLNNVTLLDGLPKELSYIGNTTKVVRSYGATSTISSITTGARNIGNIPVNGTAFVFFQATAPSTAAAIKTCDTGTTRLRNIAYVSSDQTAAKNDYADVQTCKPKETPKTPNFTIVKSVKKAGTNDEFAQEITVNPGDTVEYVIGLKNTGNVPLTNMRVRDELPQNVRYVGNTTKLVTSYGGNKNLPNIVGTSSVSIGDMPVGGTAFIFFQATAPKTTDANVKECSVGKTRLVNLGLAKPIEVVQKTDDAVINTCKPKTPTQTPNFTIVKSVKKAGTTDEFAQNVSAAPGTKLTYAIGIKNTGDTTLKNILVKDVLPAGMKYVNGSAKITTSEGVNNKPISDNLVTSGYTISSLAKGQVAFIIFDATLPEASNPIVKECSTGKTKLTNKANAKPESLPVKEDDATAETCKTTVVKQPGVSIDKKVDGVEKKEVAVGQEFTYQLVVKNTGDVDLKNAIVDDQAQSGITFVSAPVGKIGQGTIPTRFAPVVKNDDRWYWYYTIPSLKVGESKTFTIKAVVNAYKAGNLINNACVDAKEVNPNVADGKDDCDDATVTVTPPVVKHPGVSIDKKVDGVEKKEVATNQEFTYQLVVKNTGDVNLKNVSVRDAAPEGVELISTDKGTVDATKRNVSYVIPALNIGQSTTLNIKAKVTAYKTGELVNTACVNAPEVNPSEPTKADDCDTATVTVTPPAKNPAISIEKKVSKDKVAVGETFTYTLVVKNTGDVNLKNAVVSDNAPAGVQFISTDKGSVVGNKLAYTIPSLTVGQSTTITIQAKVTVYKEGSIVNTACVNTPEVNPGQPEKEDDCDDVPVTVVPPAKPVYECTSLGALSLGDLKYRFTPQINMSGTVTVTNVSYNFGDGSAAVVQNNANSVDHTYAEVDVDKTYTTTATVTFSVGGEVKSVDCAAQIKITATPDVPCEYNPELPKDHPDCKPPVVPPVVPPVTPPVTPPTQPTPQPPVSIIPATGLGGAVSGLVGTFAATYGGYALLEARRKRA
jgi:uncharacterized repeat protein (TIGR01451 family)